MDEAELPRALIKRIAKAGLSHQPSADGKDIQLSKDALLALSESARVFINYLTATGVLLARLLHRLLATISHLKVQLEGPPTSLLCTFSITPSATVRDDR